MRPLERKEEGRSHPPLEVCAYPTTREARSLYDD
jgi:hypothetical protein